MGKQVSRVTLRKAVLAGIRDAYRLHKQNSKRLFGRAPEYWVTSMIARRLGKAAPGCGVELEASVRQVLEEAHAVKPGPAHGWLRINGRFDIVLWWKVKAAPRALIEVKHPVRKGSVGTLVKDARRLLKALHLGADEEHLQWACLAFWCQSTKNASKERKTARDEVEETLKHIRKSVKVLDKDKTFRVKLHSAKRLLEERAADGKLARYAKPCCITLGRVPS